MPKAKPQTVTINANYKVEIDTHNHTLMVRNEKRKTGWETLGYFTSMATALSACSRHKVLEGADCTLKEYADAVLAEAQKICHLNS